MITRPGTIAWQVIDADRPMSGLTGSLQKPSFLAWDEGGPSDWTPMTSITEVGRPTFLKAGLHKSGLISQTPRKVSDFLAGLRETQSLVQRQGRSSAQREHVSQMSL